MIINHKNKPCLVLEVWEKRREKYSPFIAKNVYVVLINNKKMIYWKDDFDVSIRKETIDGLAERKINYKRIK